VAAPAVNLVVEHLVFVELRLVLFHLSSHVVDVVDGAFMALHLLALHVLNALVCLEVILVVEILHSSESLIVAGVSSDLAVLA